MAQNAGVNGLWMTRGQVDSANPLHKSRPVWQRMEKNRPFQPAVSLLGHAAARTSTKSG